MAYKQSNNPISRKTSPLRDKGNHPHPHNKPGIISEDKLDLKSGSTSMHDGEKPSPKLASGDMSFEPHDKDYENYPNPWEEPDYEDPDYKPGMSRKTSPFNHTGNKGHKHWNKDGTVKKDPPKREKPKKVEKVNTEPSSKVVAVKGKETKGASEVKITKKVTGKPKGTKTAKDAGKVDSSGREGTNRQEKEKA